MGKWQWGAGILACSLAGGAWAADTAPTSADLFKSAQKEVQADAATFYYGDLRPLGASLKERLEIYKAAILSAVAQNPQQKIKADSIIKIVEAVLRQLHLQALTHYASSVNPTIVDGVPLNHCRFFIGLTERQGVFSTLYAGAEKPVTEICKKLPADTLAFFDGHLNLGKMAEQLLSDPDLTQYRNQLAALPVPLLDILNAIDGEWQLTITAEADAQLGIGAILEIPDKGNMVYNLLCAFSAGSSLKMDGDQLILPLDDKNSIFIRKNGERIYAATAADYREKLAAGAAQASLADAPAFKKMLYQMPEKGKEIAYYNTQAVETVAKAIPFLPEDALDAIKQSGMQDILAINTAEGPLYCNVTMPFKPELDADAQAAARKRLNEQLDAGGTFYYAVYWPLIQQAIKYSLDNTVKLAEKNNADQETVKIKTVFDFLISAFQCIENIGISCISVGNDKDALYRHKFVIQSGKTPADGLLGMLGNNGAARGVNDFAKALPEKTLVAYVNNVDGAKLLKFLEPVLTLANKDYEKKFQEEFGMSPQQLAEAFNGEIALSLIDNPAAGEKEMPYHITIRIADKGNVLFNMLAAKTAGSKEWKNNGDSLEKVKGNAQLPLIVKQENVVLFATSAAAVEAVKVPADGKTLADDADYQKMAAGLPEKANSWGYLAPGAFGNLLANVEKRQVPIPLEILARLKAWRPGICGVGARDANGDIYTANSTLEAHALMGSSLVGGLGLSAAVSTMSVARRTARINAQKNTGADAAEKTDAQ